MQKGDLLKRGHCKLISSRLRGVPNQNVCIIFISIPCCHFAAPYFISSTNLLPPLIPRVRPRPPRTIRHMKP